MAEHERIALVLFEDEKPEIERLARSISERLQDHGVSSLIKPASLVEISDILASDLYVLGAESVNATAYGELARVFKGANLAGRKAAFFGSTGATVAWLKGLCKDTEIASAHVDLVGRPEAPALAAWLKGVLAGS